MMTNRTVTPPPLHDLPTAKEKKYDRQLRLWGASGQAALEETHILLVNHGSGVTGIEALKNLVLPGIGQFSILDPAVVTEADLGVNFFLDDDSLGKFRAEETVRLLEELNPDVKGTAVKEVRRHGILYFDATQRRADKVDRHWRPSSKRTRSSLPTRSYSSPRPSCQPTLP